MSNFRGNFIKSLFKYRCSWGYKNGEKKIPPLREKLYSIEGIGNVLTGLSSIPTTTITRRTYSKIALLYILLFIITQFLLPPYKKGTYLSTFLMYFTFQLNVWLPFSNGADTTTNEKFYIYLIPSSNCAGMHAPNVKYCQLRESLANCLAIRDETCTKIQQSIPLAWFFPRNRSSWNSFSPKISPPFLSTTYQSD